MTQPITLRQSSDLTLEVLQQVARDGRALVLHSDLIAHLAAARSLMLDALTDGQQVYGVTTATGYLAGVRIGEEEQEAHQANLLVGRAVGGPPFLDRGEVRALFVARLAGLLGGQAGVTPNLCTFLVDRLNDDFVSAVPRSGVGSAGEIIPLSHAFGPCIGVGQVLCGDGSVEDASVALSKRGVTPYRPVAKEGIALIAGAPGAVALGAVRHRDASVLFRQLQVAFACAIDAARAPLTAYGLDIARLANDPLMEEVLARLDDLLSGSDTSRHGTQAPVSLRVIPQVLTHLARVLGRMESDLRRGITAVTDSPAFVGGRFVTNGGFHAVDLASDLDFLSIALVRAAELAGQHIHRLLDSRFTGLPDQLVHLPGTGAGLVAVHKRIVGSLNELRRLANPATIGLVDTSMGQEDAMTFTFEAAEKMRRTEALAREVIACELLVCRAAWSLRSSAVAAGLRTYAEEIGDAVPSMERDRPFGVDITRLISLLESGSFQ